MTSLPAKDRSHESVLNTTLARVFRERCGLNAVSETLQGGPQPDILIRLSQGPIIVETEFEPASTVEADALSRFGMEIDGRKIQNTFAVTVPAALRTAESGAHLSNGWHRRPWLGRSGAVTEPPGQTSTGRL